MLTIPFIASITISYYNGEFQIFGLESSFDGLYKLIAIVAAINVYQV
jgi:hypothetical protein